ncbi:uncharacterized protein CTHT_0007330 [Thermochaetoides thermophila DSM 1495]|uniref:Uncharacterized protein n=1 Tax=Chaetomium thermophilum (strain DSM 1495 / CBS 144.50 / IMI 039719) TaxID=759272 RepID=G0RYN6_CHATD|nr:hypothetical protein CTHT_0007330 [Thermochaetoides thermophila DSM 1495]EGS24022.1 hypothetical protein CTHT_0007330 [Thermochaetoides thermophila DSM 1495]
MASFGRVYVSSPILAMQPQAPHQVSFGGNPFFQAQPFSFSQSSSCGARLIRTSVLAGRKRTRDEAAINLDPPEKVVSNNADYVVGTSSRSATWAEERAVEQQGQKTEAALRAQQQLAQSRPSLRSCKSQRLDLSASNDSNGSQRSGSPSREISNPMTSSSDSLSQPIVDDFTIHLGIGWSRLSPSIQDAARGWARYIENHYPVTNAKLILQSRGLESYLVEANEGYFLFDESLRKGRLVSRTPEGALRNLKVSPPVFEGADVMNASPTAKIAHSNDTATTTNTSVDIDMN